MKQVLAQKGTQIVMGLLDNMSNKNTDNLEKTLNAQTILQDFCENDHCFNILTTPEALLKLITICCEGESNRMNLPYALNLLHTIITEFSNTDKEISDERKLEIQSLFAKYFPDMAYNCILILQPSNTDTQYVNQTQMSVERIGTARIRAIELLKTLVLTATKIKDGKHLISVLLKSKIIDTMLQMIKRYPFACVSH